MNMKYLELEETLTECHSCLINNVITQVSQYSSRSLIIHCQKGEVKNNLLISLQTPFVRAHLTHHQGVSSITPFFSALNKYITTLTISQLSLLQHDRILKITAEDENSQYTIIAELFSKSPNCYLIDFNGKILHSLFKVTQVTYQPPEEQQLPPPPPLTAPVSSATIEKHYDAAESTARFEREKTQIRKIIYRRLKKSKRSIEELTKQLNSCLAWEQTHHQAELLQANLYQIKKGMKDIEVDDWITSSKIRISLDPTLPTHKQVEKLFRQSKKLKKGIEHLPRQIEEREAERARLENQLEILSRLNSHEELSIFCNQHGWQPASTPSEKKNETKPRLPYHRYISSKGIEILVGKKDQDNDRLTFHYANGSDWWLHVSERPGSHVIIKTQKGAEPDPQTLHEACHLAIAHSKAKGEKGAEVVITQQKHLKRAKGRKPGTVFLSQHKKMWVDFDPTIVKTVKSNPK
jgi:predicted ribosome quality control (RQC) complex YloA/Tae2 family protein